ncbi:MAG TPA: hypothetical protein VN806_02945 [Caulobacteraceae bacterium]|nr:hypothetical protein [Caulobacteraceae bacterium]
MPSPAPTLEVCRPRARLRVGVTGHRPGSKFPPEAEPQVRATVKQLLEAIGRDLARVRTEHEPMFAPEPAEVVVVSSLAEGADRIVAELGLACGSMLEVVLPGPRAEYALDFESAASKAAFHELLGKAQSVFELESAPGELGKPRGYEAAGLIMLAHSDLLIAIWDGGESGGIGGTAEIVEQAVNGGCPVMVISPSAPERVRLLWTGDDPLPPHKTRVEQMPDRDGLHALPSLMTLLAAPPRERSARAELKAFYDEEPGRRRWTPVYTLFLALLGVRRLRPDDFGPVPQTDLDGETWRARFPSDHGEDGLTQTVLAKLSPVIAGADAQAVLYSEFYRSAFVFNYLAAAVAVTLALTGLLPEIKLLHDILGNAGSTAFKAALVSSELALIVSILWIWRRGAARQWHRRWLDYRRLAENLRHLRMLTLVGARGTAPRPRAPSHHGVFETHQDWLDRLTAAVRGAPAETVTASEDGRPVEALDKPDWVEWMLRAHERLLPLPNRAITAGYVAAVRDAVTDAELQDQIEWNTANAERMEAAEHRLHTAGNILFGTPALVCTVFLVVLLTIDVPFGHDWAHSGRFYVTALSAACPGFGAALNAIRMQGDFESVARRSATTTARLEAIRRELHIAHPLDFARLADLVQKTAEVLDADVSEWRTLFRTRPLSLPA